MAVFAGWRGGFLAAALAVAALTQGCEAPWLPYPKKPVAPTVAPVGPIYGCDALLPNYTAAKTHKALVVAAKPNPQCYIAAERRSFAQAVVEALRQCVAENPSTSPGSPCTVIAVDDFVSGPVTANQCWNQAGNFNEQPKDKAEILMDVPNSPRCRTQSGRPNVEAAITDAYTNCWGFVADPRDCVLVATDFWQATLQYDPLAIEKRHGEMNASLSSGPIQKARIEAAKVRSIVIEAAGLRSPSPIQIVPEVTSGKCDIELTYQYLPGPVYARLTLSFAGALHVAPLGFPTSGVYVRGGLSGDLRLREAAGKAATELAPVPVASVTLSTNRSEADRTLARVLQDAVHSCG